MPTTALIAGGLGAAGSIGSALIGANASKNAANAQLTAQQQALAQQKSMFGVAQNALNPFINLGSSVLPTLQNLITPGPSQTSTLEQTPGFQFASQYGNMAATNSLAAKTGPSAGPLATAISQYNQGLASNQFQNIVGNLQNAASLGGNAANALAGGAINAGNSQANTLGNIGNANASGILGSANAISNGLTGATGAGGNALTNSAIFSYLQQQNGGGIYSPNALTNGPTNSQISNLTDAQADQYEQLYG